MPNRSRTPPLKELQAEFDALRDLIRKNGGKDPVAVAFGRRGGLKGARTLNARLTPAQRRASASRAAQARWNRKP